MLSGSGWASCGVSLIQLAPSLYQSDIGIARQTGIENAEFCAHLRLEALDETIDFDRQFQRRVIGRTLGLKVGGQVLVRVAIAVCADDPDLLAAQPRSKGLEHANLVGDAVDALAALGVGLHHGVTPEAVDDAVERHVFIGREDALFGVRMTA